MQYWDTSTLLKLYVPETDSAQFAAHMTNSPVVSSELARWELLRAIVGKETSGAIPPNSSETVFAKFRSDVKTGRIVLLNADGAVETRFRSIVVTLHRRPTPILIRTADALHLATALNSSASEVVTTDVRMKEGAAALGLKVFP